MRVSLFFISLVFAALTPSIALGDAPMSAPGVSVSGYSLHIANPAGLVGVEVLFDGKWRGVTPLVIEGVRPGKHSLLLRAKGFHDSLKVLDVGQDGVSIQTEIHESGAALLLQPKNLKRLGVGAVIVSGVFYSAALGITLANRSPSSGEFSSSSFAALEPRDTSFAATGFAVAGDISMIVGVGSLLIRRMITKGSSEASAAR